MDMAHARSNAYCKYYVSQAGGELPVFRGGQHGAGLGDILRGILRFVAPIALRGFTTFANTTMQAHEKGASLKDAAKSAIMPALGAMGNAVATRTQSGGAAIDSVLFTGEHGVPFSHAYKRNRERGGKKSRKAKRRRTAPDSTATNF